MNRSGDTLIQQTYFDQHPLFAKQKKLISRIALKLARIFAFLGVIIVLALYIPSVWYMVKSGGENFSSLIVKTARLGTDEIIKTQAPLPDRPPYQPRLDAGLPSYNYLSIPAIGVETQLQEALYENYEDALKEGVWRVPEAGDPYNRSKPTILVAHRYGYLRWSHAFRLKNSFYNLPKLKAGDTVQVVWKQRMYFYEIYAESKGEEIEDFSADLILYTCESLNSSVRIFRYARLLEI